MAEVTTIQIRGEDRTAAAFRSANKGLDRLERNLQTASAKTATLTAGLGKLGGVMANKLHSIHWTDVECHRVGFQGPARCR